MHLVSKSWHEIGNDALGRGITHGELEPARDHDRRLDAPVCTSLKWLRSSKVGSGIGLELGPDSGI